MPIVMKMSCSSADDRRDRHPPLEVRREEHHEQDQEDHQALAVPSGDLRRPSSARPPARRSRSPGPRGPWRARATTSPDSSADSASVWIRISSAPTLGTTGSSMPAASADGAGLLHRRGRVRHAELGAALELDAEVEPAAQQADDGEDQEHRGRPCTRRRRLADEVVGRPRRCRAGAPSEPRRDIRPPSVSAAPAATGAFGRGRRARRRARAGRVESPDQPAALREELACAPGRHQRLGEQERRPPRR